jgi:hypothetical protein
MSNADKAREDLDKAKAKYDSGDETTKAAMRKEAFEAGQKHGEEARKEKDK